MELVAEGDPGRQDEDIASDRAEPRHDRDHAGLAGPGREVDEGGLLGDPRLDAGRPGRDDRLLPLEEVALRPAA